MRDSKKLDPPLFMILSLSDTKEENILRFMQKFLQQNSFRLILIIDNVAKSKVSVQYSKKLDPPLFMILSLSDTKEENILRFTKKFLQQKTS